MSFVVILVVMLVDVLIMVMPWSVRRRSSSAISAIDCIEALPCMRLYFR